MRFTVLSPSGVNQLAIGSFFLALFRELGVSPMLGMLRRKQNCPGAVWLYLAVCIWALDGKHRETSQESRNPSFAKPSQPPGSQGPSQTWFRMTPVPFWCLQLNFAITTQDSLWNQRGTTQLLLGDFLPAASCRTLFYSLCLFDIWHKLLCGCLPARTVLICPGSFLSAYGLCLGILC